MDAMRIDRVATDTGDGMNDIEKKIENLISILQKMRAKVDRLEKEIECTLCERGNMDRRDIKAIKKRINKELAWLKGIATQREVKPIEIDFAKIAINEVIENIERAGK